MYNREKCNYYVLTPKYYFQLMQGITYAEGKYSMYSVWLVSTNFKLVTRMRESIQCILLAIFPLGIN